MTPGIFFCAPFLARLIPAAMYATALNLISLLLIFFSEFLEVEPVSPSSSSVILSFPKDYLGDKQTAYSQRLSLIISLPYFDKSLSTSTSLSVCLEIVGRTVRYPQVRIIWRLETENLGAKPHLIEVVLQLCIH